MVAQLPAHVRPGNVDERYGLELEALSPIADLVEVEGSSPEAFARGAGDADAVITSWGIRFDREIIVRLEKCVVIGVGSVGVDMVDIAAATEAGIVVTQRTGRIHRGGGRPRHDAAAGRRPPASG